MQRGDRSDYFSLHFGCSQGEAGMNDGALLCVLSQLLVLALLIL